MKKLLTAWMLMLAMLLACLGGAWAQTPTEDRAGNAIEVPENVERIITLAPSITQVVIDLGMADKIIAIDTYSAGTKGLAEDLPAFEMMAPDMEQMLALEPDVVFVTGMSLAEGNDPFVVLTEAGVCVAYIPSSASIEGIMEDTLFIGQVLGDEEGAQELNNTLAEGIEKYKVETDDPIPVFFEIGFPYTFGSETFLNEMIELLGGRNIFADQQGWITVSDEAVIDAAPEIIFTNADWDPQAVEGIMQREGWDSIPAVENGRVYMITGDTSSQPNHRIIYALEEMAQAFAQYEK